MSERYFCAFHVGAQACDRLLPGKQKKHLIVLETTVTIMFTFDWNDFK